MSNDSNALPHAHAEEHAELPRKPWSAPTLTVVSVQGHTDGMVSLGQDWTKSTSTFS